jgi:hypothetical protein
LTITKKHRLRLLVGVAVFIGLLSYSSLWGKLNKQDEKAQFNAIVSQQLLPFKSDENTLFIKSFDSFWLKGSLSDAQKKEIENIASLIDKRNLAADPFLTSYLRSVMVFYDSTSSIKGYEAWCKGVRNVLTRKGVSSGVILNLLKGPTNYKADRTIYANDYIRWQVDTLNLTFQYDTTLFVKLLPKTKVISYCQRDTARIFATTGTFYPIWGTIKGLGGQVFWKKSGYDTTKVFANIKTYTLNLSQTTQKFDSVKFTFADVLKNPISGSLTLSYNDVNNPEQTYYPQFSSYNRSIAITNLFDSLNFVGGLSIKGRIFIGYGTSHEPATVTIIKAKKPFIIAKSQSFQIKSDGLVANDASIVLRMVKDSIIHSNKMLVFNNQNRELRLTTSQKDMLTKGPYLDSYHQIGIIADQLYWNLKSNLIRFNAQIGSNQSEAIFESFNFFNQDLFDGLMRHDEKHPVFEIRKYERENKSKGPLTCDGFSRFAKKTNSDAEQLLKEMAFLGYIIYDKDSRIFRTTAKMRDAVKARSGKQDYDAILFVSENQSKRDNAQLDLDNFNLSIHGIEQINLADSQRVKVYPRNNTVILKHNRDMEFDGEVHAGLATFKGSGFKFNYDTFTIDFEKVVSMNFDYPTKRVDNLGNRMLNTITSTIENITGTLSLDDPNNKSGLKRNPSFPKFKSKTDSYIFYDDPSIFGGVYKRDKFYFRLYPYEIDSLTSFEKGSLKFNGEMVSADIFTPFEHTISVQKDESLGFTRKLDSTGVTVYKGKGRFYNTVNLSNQGLIGDGSLRYVTSKSNSNAIYFFPDSCVSNLKSMTIDRQLAGIEFPNGNSGEHLMKWLPYKNVMDFYRDKSPFNLYDNQAVLSGDLKLQPIGLSGVGNLKVNTAQINSTGYQFRAYTFDATPSFISIFDEKLEAKLYEADSVDTKIDLMSYKGTISKNGTTFTSRYPQLSYMSITPTIAWDMNNQTLAFTSSKKIELPNTVANTIKLDYNGFTPEGAVLVSTKKEQDSLCFATPTATYLMREQKLAARSVKQMLLGDAALLLNSQHDTVTLRHGAAMDRISKAELVASRNNKRLNFYNVDINVGGRNGFKGAGDYTYIDKYEKKDTIRFATITLDSTYRTIAYADIDEAQDFFLSPFFKFKGKAVARSEQKHILFDGGAQFTHKHKSLAKNWLRFTAEIAPDSVMIPMNAPYQSVNKVRVYAGTHLRRDSIGVYPTFFTGRKYTQDSAFISPEGFIYYNDNGGYYQFSSLSKIKRPSTAGSMISLYNEFDLLVNEGNLNLGVDLGEVRLTSAGKAIQEISSKDLKFSGILTLDFLFNNESLNVLNADVLAGSANSVDYKSPEMAASLRELLGDKKSLEIINSYAKTPTLEKLPEEFAHTLTLTDVQMKWNKKWKSYISYGDIGVANIGGKQVNRKVKGFIELAPNNDHRMYVYLDLGNDRYALFVYTSAGNMFAASSNEQFNIPIDKTSAKKRSIKRGLWETTYIYTNADERIINTVKSRYNEVKMLNSK